MTRPKPKWSLTEITLFSFRRRRLRLEIVTEYRQAVGEFVPLRWKTCSISFELCYESPKA
jgi:hypothetical protein